METLKSFILSMALVDNHLTVETAVHLSRLELEFQVVHCFLKIDVDSISCMYATCGLSQGNIAQLLGWDKKRSVGTGARIRVKSGHEYWQWNSVEHVFVWSQCYYVFCKFLGEGLLAEHWSPYSFRKRRLCGNHVIFLTGFFSSKSRMTGDCCVLKFLQPSADGKHLMRFQFQIPPV